MLVYHGGLICPNSERRSESIVEMVLCQVMNNYRSVKGGSSWFISSDLFDTLAHHVTFCHFNWCISPIVISIWVFTLTFIFFYVFFRSYIGYLLLTIVFFVSRVEVLKRVLGGVIVFGFPVATTVASGLVKGTSSFEGLFFTSDFALHPLTVLGPTLEVPSQLFSLPFLYNFCIFSSQPDLLHPLFHSCSSGMIVEIVRPTLEIVP
jgi:hypothetical protein